MQRYLVSAILVFGACASSGLTQSELLGQASVVNRAKEGIRPAVRLDADQASRRLLKARQAFFARDYERCLKIIRETLQSGPPSEISGELRALRIETRRILVARKVIEARVLPERDVFTVDEEVTVKVLLRNLSELELSLPVSISGSSDTLFVIDVVREHWDIYGNVLRDEERRFLPLPDDVCLGPEGTMTIPFRFPGGRVADRHLGFTAVRLRGMLRPSVIRCGEQRYYTGVKLAECSLRILPPGFEPIAADPLGTLTKAFRLGAREHLLIAAELTPLERRSEVLEVLVGFLEEGPSPAMAETVMAALHRLTGHTLPRRPSLWITWHKEGGADGVD